MMSQQASVIHATANVLSQSNNSATSDAPLLIFNQPLTPNETKDEAERRRENLARRPSYRKILNALTGGTNVSFSNSGGQGYPIVTQNEFSSVLSPISESSINVISSPFKKETVTPPPLITSSRDIKRSIPTEGHSNNLTQSLQRDTKEGIITKDSLLVSPLLRGTAIHSDSSDNETVLNLSTMASPNNASFGDQPENLVQNAVSNSSNTSLLNVNTGGSSENSAIITPSSSLYSLFSSPGHGSQSLTDGSISPRSRIQSTAALVALQQHQQLQQSSNNNPGVLSSYQTSVLQQASSSNIGSSSTSDSSSHLIKPSDTSLSNNLLGNRDVSPGSTVVSSAMNFSGIPALQVLALGPDGSPARIQSTQSNSRSSIEARLHSPALDSSGARSSPLASPNTADLASLASGHIPSKGISLLQGSTIAAHHTSLPEDAIRKREIRLLKNREAAKECRRKKKEYVKCLEQRVSVLESQNRKLMEELKHLKEMYCKRESTTAVAQSLQQQQHQQELPTDAHTAVAALGLFQNLPHSTGR